MASIQGTNGNDSNISNPSSNDTVYLAAGDDVYRLGNGNDTVSGGDGNDRIASSGGLMGLGIDASANFPNASSSSQTVFGEAGDDYITSSGLSASRLYGGDGVDTMTGSSGNDTILGGSGDDQFSGNGGNDRLYGEEGNDRINGSLGNDTLVGGNGEDTLTGSSAPRFGGVDNDTDVLYGGNGRDTFVLGETFDGVYYSINGSNDRAYIEDFQSGEDNIELLQTPDYYFLQASGSDTIIYYDTDNDGLSYDEIAVVRNNTDLDLNSGDFTFV